jgi:hypothetical protein
MTTIQNVTQYCSNHKLMVIGSLCLFGLMIEGVEYFYWHMKLRYMSSRNYHLKSFSNIMSNPNLNQDLVQSNTLINTEKFVSNIVEYMTRLNPRYFPKITNTLTINDRLNRYQMEYVVTSMANIHSTITNIDHLKLIKDHMVTNQLSIFDNIDETIVNPYIQSQHIHLPIMLRIIFTFQYWHVLKSLRIIGYQIKLEKRYHMLHYTGHSNKKLIIFFHGLDGIFAGGNVNKLYHYFVGKANVLIPVFTPISLTYHQNLDGNIEDFVKYIENYLKDYDYDSIDLYALSYGALIGQGFLKKFKRTDLIDKVIFIEPLCLFRTCCMCLGANYKSYWELVKTLGDYSTVKYQYKNLLLAFLIQSSIGRAAFWSLIQPLRLVEWGKTLNKYNTHIFISESDPLINNNHDNDEFINVFSECTIYIRPGYHCGWFLSRELIKRLDIIYDCNIEEILNCS